MATPIGSPSPGRRDEESLEREIGQLKRSLKLESQERDTLEKENSDLERKNKQFQRKIKDLEADIAHESSERDVLDRENANLEKKFRSLELEMKNYKGQLQLAEETVLSLKEARQKLIKKAEDQEKEAEREAEQLRNDLRSAKREVREKTKRLEEDKDSLERELKRLGGKKLEDKVKTLEREKSDLEMKLKLAQSSSSSSSSSGSVVPNSVVNQLLEEKSELEKTKDKLEEKLKSIESKAKETEREREAFQSKQKELEDSLKALKAKVNEAEEKKEASEKERLQIEQEMAKLKRSHRDEIESLATQSGNVELQKSLDELRNLFEEEKENKADLQRFNDELERRNAELKVEIAEMESTEIEFLEERKRLTEKLSNAQSDKGLINELQEQLDKIKRKLTKENEALKEQLENEKKAKEKAEEKRQGLSRSLSNLSLNQDKQSSIMSESEKAVRKELLDAQEALNEERSSHKTKEEKTKKKHESELSQLKDKVEEVKEDSTRITKEKNQIEEEFKRFKKESEEILLQLEREKEAKRQSEISLRKLNEGLEEEGREKTRLKKALELATSQREESEKGILEKLESSEKERIKTEREVNDLKSKLEEEHSKINALKNQLSDVKSKLEQNNSQKAKQEEDSVNAEKNEIERLSNQLSQLSTQANESKSLIEKAENLRKNLEGDLQALNEELKEERVSSQKWKTARDQLDQQLLNLQDQLDSQKTGRESDAKAKKELESELEKLTTEKEKVNKEKSSLEREKADALRETSSLREEKNSLEVRKNKAEGELSSLSKKLEEESAAREENETSVKRLNKELKELQENFETLKSQQKEDKSSQLLDENQRLKNELNQVKQKSVELEGHGDKIITLEKRLYESKGQTEAQTTKAEKAKERKNHFKKQLQELKSQLESLKSQPASPDASALQSENARLRAEVQALRESASVDLDSDALSSAGPRLATVRRPLGPRASRNLGVPLTVSAPKEESSQVEEKTPTISIEKKAAMMGGVSLLGGASLGAELLAAKTRPRSTSVAAQNMESDGKKRLWQLKGRRRIRSFQVEVAFKSLNQGDVFVLDAGLKIYQWNGSECNRLERTKGKDIVARLNRQKGSKAEVVTLDQEDKDDPQMHSFWKEIGGKSGEVASTASGGDDLEAENQLDNKTRLFRVNESGPLEEVAQGKLSMEMLDSNGVFVIDTNDEVYLWFGKLSSKGSLRTIGQSQAEALLESNRSERPSFTELFKVADGGESVFFCEKFSDWPDGGTLGPQKFNSNVAASKKQEKINVESMYQSSNDPPAPTYYLAKGDVPFTVEVHVVVDAVKEEIASADVGKFYSGHSYIVTYAFGLNEKSYIIYFWQGRDGSKNEKGTSAALSMNLAKKLPGANQVRVVQGKEPADFLKLFKGKFLVLKGKRNEPLAKPLLVCVSAPKSSEESCATQVPSNTSSLNTGYSYLLRDSNGQDFIWNGSQSNSSSAEAAAKVLEFLGGSSSSAKSVSEESTPSEFFKSLSGESSQILAKDKRRAGWANKFFLFSNASGMLTADRQVIFSQEDLSSDGIYLLDTYFNVFLWIGSKAREADKKTALETALNYLQFAIKADGRPSSVTVSNVKEGSEPAAFTASFFGWDKGASGSGPVESASDALSQYSKLYSFDELKDKDKLPATVDKSQLEMYLEDAEFVRIFGMDKATWLTTPAWKKTPKKKEVGLF
eukprot:TRINITY_DN205_c0_g1_i1.p1 TRINITY_DN205_c0_g1~~TRINITY_DN205_c0_g1_i1.p1  ORF type:complete len:1692 (+),score=893.77 TRINITY_DN205_c0_g1_i1:53-5128(+)